MIHKQKNNIQYLQFSNFSEFKDIIHFSTTRLSGKSKGILSSFNLGYTVNDNPKNVNENLDSLAHALDIKRSQMVSPKQSHTKNIGIVKTENDLFNNTDALITKVPNICIFVRTADCVPILLYDPVQKAAAAIHSGWKSTIQEISRHTILLMQKEYDTNPNHLIAGIGGPLSLELYSRTAEVDADLAALALVIYPKWPEPLALLASFDHTGPP